MEVAVAVSFSMCMLCTTMIDNESDSVSYWDPNAWHSIFFNLVFDFVLFEIKRSTCQRRKHETLNHLVGFFIK